jgi:hypothetical protein
VYLVRIVWVIVVFAAAIGLALVVGRLTSRRRGR